MDICLYFCTFNSWNVERWTICEVKICTISWQSYAMYQTLHCLNTVHLLSIMNNMKYVLLATTFLPVYILFQYLVLMYEFGCRKEQYLSNFWANFNPSIDNMSILRIRFWQGSFYHTFLLNEIYNTAFINSTDIFTHLLK